MNKIIIEIGAKDGHDTDIFLQDSNNIVYSFEPTPALVVNLQNRFKFNQNWNLIPAAVDLTNGFKQFNIAGVEDWGCSSLFEFKEDRYDHWPGRNLQITDVARVMTMRLDSFMEMYEINEVEYLWIDAQGNDFNVLKSLGNKIHNIKRGKCETAYKADLYKNTDNRTTDVVEWLEERGFRCYIELECHTGNEADVHFERISK